MPGAKPSSMPDPTEWRAALDGIILFLIGDEGYEGLFHKQLFRAQDHFGSMPANSAVIMKAMAGDSLLDPDSGIVFRPTGLKPWFPATPGQARHPS